MKAFKSLAICAVVFFSGFSAFAQNSDYVLRGVSTWLWDHDVDYMSPPITLHRTKDTFSRHTLEFSVLSYSQTCLAWSQVCVAYDNHGKCTAYQTVCVQWGYQTIPISKRLDIDFSPLAVLQGSEEEVYRVTINRMQPGTNGEDSVSTWLDPVKTKVPVKIFKMNDYSYRIDVK